MTNFFSRLAIARTNEFKQSLGALVGIAQGLICDARLNDEEIHFLDQWLKNNDAVSTTWPGDIIYARLQRVLADGKITDEERVYLIDTLKQLIGGTLEDLATNKHVTQLIFDDVKTIEFLKSRFCLTGEFVFAPREHCATEIVRRGGIISNNITKNLRYLIVGGLGSPEWRHGSFGIKIENAMNYKRNGVPILIVPEDRWANSL